MCMTITIFETIGTHVDILNVKVKSIPHFVRDLVKSVV